MTWRALRQLLFAGLFASVLGWSPARAPADDIEALHQQYQTHLKQRRFADAEVLARQMVAIADKSAQEKPALLAECLQYLGDVCSELHHYDEAESAFKRSAAIREEVFGPDYLLVAVPLNNLACLYQELGRFDEAEPLFQRVLQMRETSLGADHTLVAHSLNNLGCLYDSLGHHADAEPLCKRALVIREKVLGPQHQETAESMNNLGLVYDHLGRYAESEALYRRALAVKEQQLDGHDPSLAVTMNNLALLYHHQRRYDDAQPLFDRALAIWEEVYGPDDPRAAVVLGNLAALYDNQGNYSESESLYRRALAIRQKVLGAEHPDVALTLTNLAACVGYQGRPDEEVQLLQQALDLAEKRLGPVHPYVAVAVHNLAWTQYARGDYGAAAPLADRAVSLRERSQSGPSDKYLTYYVRGRIYWKLGRRDEALADLSKAMDLVEQQRAWGAGGERERAAFFAGFAEVYEQVVAWHYELGDAGAAMEAIERGRARSLIDQLETRGIDLLAGVPAAEADELRRRESESQLRVSSLERQLQLLAQRAELDAAERKVQMETLLSLLRGARQDYAVAYADMRSASPAYRLAVGRNRRPVSLANLQSWLAPRHALLLEYLVGHEGAYVVIVPPVGTPRLERLRVDDEQAGSLGLERGPLTARRLESALINEQRTGVLQRLRAADRPAAVQAASPGLASLWELLIPPAERAAILAREVQRLVVVPDGGLVQLPFETLVTRSGQEPVFLLDSDVVIEYAPSATILVNLSERAAVEHAADQSVLTVGDPAYGRSQGTAAGLLAQLTSGAQYRSLGGSLTRLPFTAWETAWVQEVFAKNDISAIELRGAEASEANVRTQVPGRRIVHLACHGLTDQSLGNLFGALALTPGPQGDGDPADDGFLTLAEIYQLDLESCELAILSACDTNLGPQQRGEGVFALSRGFLVAGSRRVVASNWLVDDEAAAGLISHFCSSIGLAEKQGQPVDYAASLLKAKSWVRQQAKWNSPYYWGTFVLIGPD